MGDKSIGGPNIGLLLIIPAAAIVARAAMRHHQMLWDEPGEPGAEMPYRRHRHGPGRFGPGAAGRGDFRLPPRLEFMLDTWHTRAHEAAAEQPAASEGDVRV